MTGFAGGEVTDGQFDALFSGLWQEPWYEDERFHRRGLGLGLRHHGSRDPAGHTVWRGDGRSGVVYGVVSNLDALGLDAGGLFTRLLDRPTEVLPELDGTFVVAAVDALAEKAVVATDKLGTRPCYYTPRGRFLFGSEVDALLSQVDRPTVDRQGLSDLLLMGHLWSDHTLVEQVRALDPGTVLQFVEGERSTSRYWEHDFTPTENDRATFADELTTVYQSAVSDVASTMDGTVGLWLSGGLDSRALLAELERHLDSVETYTYDANPAAGGNPEIARRVADTLGVENQLVDLTPDRFLEVLDRSVRITDGMVSWKTLLNISSTFHIPETPNVMLEGSGQGGLLGYDVWYTTLQQADTPEEALYRSDHLLPAEHVVDLLNYDVDPLDTYRREAERSPADDFTSTVLDAYYRNFYPRGDFASNQLAQSQVGTRVPFAHGDFLRHVTSMPPSERARAIPFTEKVPYGTAPMKLELARALGRGLDEITYERTAVSPARPMWQHAIGFVTSQSVALLRSKTTYGGRKLSGEWYRRHEPFREQIDELLDDACQRPLFDADALRRRRREHLAGDGEHIDAIAGVTTAELWLQRHFD
jgi:asparagine synthase (glutamine-hydrolysing)